MAKLKQPVQLAVIAAAHGITGEVRVKTFTADPLSLGRYGPLTDGDGRSFVVSAIRGQGGPDMAVVRFAGISERNQAEALNGTALYVERSMLPAAAADEFYHADLIGLTVKGEAGDTLGTVQAVQNFGGGDLLDVRLAGGATVVIPFTAAAVPEVSLDGGWVRVDAVAAGLAADDDPSDGGQPQERPRRPRGAGGRG